jgi:hypothetical protein
VAQWKFDGCSSWEENASTNLPAMKNYSESSFKVKVGNIELSKIKFHAKSRIVQLVYIVVEMFSCTFIFSLV